MHHDLLVEAMMRDRMREAADARRHHVKRRILWARRLRRA